jgi:hypothetical protein
MASMNKFENLDKKTFAIGILSLSAVALLVANLIHVPPAKAAMAIKDRDYQAVTARVNRGGEALYLTDNRTGLMAVFVYDPSKRAVLPLTVEPVSKAFAGGAAVPAGGGKTGTGRGGAAGARP